MDKPNKIYNRLRRLNDSPHLQSLWCVFRNTCVVFLFFSIGRIAFYLTNQSFFPDFWENHWGLLLTGSLQFDLSGILYFNLLYLILHLLPLPFRWSRNKAYRTTERISWISMNSIALALNFFDTMYFPFSQRRSTASVFAEFQNTDNLFLVLCESMVNHWILSIVSISMIISLFFLYRPFHLRKDQLRRERWKHTVALRSIAFITLIGLCIVGIRGGVSKAVRPITLSNANQYVSKPTEAAIILNSAFTVVRTIENKQYPDFHFFKDETLADQLFPTYKEGSVGKGFLPYNVVLLVMESFGSEYIGALNRDIQQGEYKGYTPFLDSLIDQSVTFHTSIANGHKSIDALPSVLASIPSFIEPYFVGDFGNNRVESIAGALKNKGYHSAFFHGAPNGSMGFWAFAKASGFDKEFGMNEYNNNKDFDGTWAIWDEPFMQFFAKQMNQFKEPFVTCLFTASSHHPFRLPKQYVTRFPEENLPIHKCIRYSDLALRKFFETAQKSEWFDRTLFVITGDHSNQSELAEYKSTIGNSSVPIIFYAPSLLKPNYRDEVAQQIDIKPSILGLLNYNLPQIGFGRNLFANPPHPSFAINEAGGYFQYLSDQWLLQFDGNKSVGLYHYRTDRLLKQNQLHEMQSTADSLERRLKAALQVYMKRMRNNQLQ